MHGRGKGVAWLQGMPRTCPRELAPLPRKGWLNVVNGHLKHLHHHIITGAQ